MKLVRKPDYNRSVGALLGTTRGAWKIDGLPLAVCRPVSSAEITEPNPLTRDGRARQWAILSDDNITHADWVLISRWLANHSLGNQQYYPTRARALDALNMALTSDPDFFVDWIPRPSEDY